MPFWPFFKENSPQELTPVELRDKLIETAAQGSRRKLLCALAGTLPAESPERLELVDRAGTLEGSLVAQAAAKLIERQ